MYGNTKIQSSVEKKEKNFEELEILKSKNDTLSLQNSILEEKLKRYTVFLKKIFFF